MNFIKQLILRTYHICNEEVAVGIQAVQNSKDSDRETYIAWWNLTRYQDEYISKTKIQLATVCTNMNCHINSKEIILITQMNNNNNQYKLKIIFKTPEVCAIFSNTNWDVTYRFYKEYEI